MDGKWDYATREWYRKGENVPRVFKVLLKDEACTGRLKRRVRVLSSEGKTLLVMMDRYGLEYVTADECVLYVELEKRVEPER